MRRLATIVLILGLASQAFAQQVSPPAVIGPLQEPETRKLGDIPLMTTPRLLPPEEGRPSVSEFVGSLTAECDPDRKPGDPAADGAAPACLQKPKPDEKFIRPPFLPPPPRLHPDYGKGRLYPLAPL